MPYDNVYSEKRTPGALRTVWRNFYGDTTAMIGFYGCIGLVLLCVLGSWFAPYGIDQQFLGYQLLPPSWSRYGEVSFFLGTDDLGRDVLSRLLSGAAPTVGGAFVVTLAAAICGLALGIFAAQPTGCGLPCLIIFLIPCSRFLRCCWRLSSWPSRGRTSHMRCSPSGWPFCPAWCDRFTAWFTTNWRKNMSSPPVWTVPPRLIFCGLPCCLTLPPGW